MEKSTETKIIEAKIVSLGTATELTLGGNAKRLERTQLPAWQQY